MIVEKTENAFIDVDLTDNLRTKQQITYSLEDRALLIDETVNPVLVNKYVQGATYAGCVFTGMMLGSLAAGVAIQMNNCNSALFPIPLAISLITFGFAVTSIYFAVAVKFNLCRCGELVSR